MTEKEKVIEESERLKFVQCKSCGSYRTKLAPIDVEYRLTKECGPRIMGYHDKPFIGEITSKTLNLFKDCMICNSRERIKLEDVKYYIDGYLGMKE